MSDKELDPVEWELVRADIAMEKARLKSSGEWSKWEAFQAQTDARFGARLASAARIARAARQGRSETEEDRVALWCALRARDLSFLIEPIRKLQRRGWPLR
jgi:hypothetical protein